MDNDITRTRRLAIALSLTAACSSPQSATEVRAAPSIEWGTPSIERVENEPPARIVVDAPIADALEQGRVVIQYRTENLHLRPVFGPAALEVTPRVGHVHVAVDDAPWVWADASGEPVVIVGLTPGPHRIAVRAQTANHQQLDEQVVEFTVPETAHAHRAPGSAAGDEPPPRILLDPPLAEPLSRGVVFLRYRTENLQVVPVFGQEAVAISPRIGHVHVTVDDEPWHWADASGHPIIVGGLPPGPHRILVELATPDHAVLDRAVAEVVVPPAAHAAHH